MTNAYKPLNYRIVRHVTKTRILTIEDALAFGKVKVDIVHYGKAGIEAAGVHYLDAQVAALLFFDILQVEPLRWQDWTDYKGTQAEGELQARVFNFQLLEASTARNPLKFSIWNGPGVATATGAVKPKSGEEGTKVAVLLTWKDARAIALAVLQHIQAWQAATYHARLLAGTFQPTDETDAGTVDRRTGDILDGEEAT
jgi:hypothetical protein